MFVHRKMDGTRAPRDDRRRAQHNEGELSLKRVMMMMMKMTKAMTRMTIIAALLSDGLSQITG